jgi:hypothetical protein
MDNLDTFTEELREYLKTEREALKEKQLTEFWDATSNTKLDISL